MPKKYPRIGNIRKDDKNRNLGLCRICGENRADRRITIEIWHMRGDDEVYNFHQNCIEDMTAAEILKGITNGKR